MRTDKVAYNETLTAMAPTEMTGTEGLLQTTAKVRRVIGVTRVAAVAFRGLLVASLRERRVRALTVLAAMA